MAGEGSRPPAGDSPDLAELLVQGVQQLLDASSETAASWRNAVDDRFRGWKRWLGPQRE